MNLRQQRRQAELAVIEAARSYVSGGTPATFALLVTAVRIHDAVPLGPTHKAKSRGVEVNSEMAAAFMNGRKAKELSGQILYLLIYSSTGATTDELEGMTNRSHQSVSARVHELAANGWIEVNGDRKTRSGLDAAVYRLTRQARTLLHTARYG